MNKTKKKVPCTECGRPLYVYETSDKDASAYYSLGETYYMGEGVEQDKEEAVKWYRLAAEQGHALAQYSLGVLYDRGEGVTQDAREMVKWIRLAAEQGLARAQCSLGHFYSKGEGVTQNATDTVKWYRLAAEQGHNDAQFYLGDAYLYERGGVVKNIREAYIWHSIAVAFGNTGSAIPRDNAAAKMSKVELHQAQAEARERLEEIYKTLDEKK